MANQDTNYGIPNLAQYVSSYWEDKDFMLPVSDLDLWPLDLKIIMGNLSAMAN